MRSLLRLVGRVVTACAVVMIALSSAAIGAAPAHATASTVTYTAQVTVSAPPASTFVGASAGGDGWAVALTTLQMFNVFHHLGYLQVNCHQQVDASDCGWGGPKTITGTGANASGFAVSGMPGLTIDQSSGFLYVFASRVSDTTAGVVCIDTTQPASIADPFCGFTPLSAVGDAPFYVWSGITDPVVVGTKWYAFNEVAGPPTGTRDTLLCFDLSTHGACAGQPFALSYGGGVITQIQPSPGIAAAGTKLMIPVPTDPGNEVLSCFDTATNTRCAGNWPVPIGVNGNGSPFPLLSASGTPTGICFPTGADPCYDLNGSSVPTPAGLSAAIPGNLSWDGPAVTINARIYVPYFSQNQVGCYDYATDAECANFPVRFLNLYQVYTVNADPRRPSCLWVNSDADFNQIQNFDAFTGGPCGTSPVRIPPPPSSGCTPTQWTSMQVVSPGPSTYTHATVDFQDPSGNAIPTDATHTLDATGSTALTDLDTSTQYALPQFVVKFENLSGAPALVHIQFTWSGTYQPGCVTATTTVNGSTIPGAPTAPSGAAAGDTSATVFAWTAPVSDGYSPITSYRVTASPGGQQATGASAPIVVTGLANNTGYTFTVAAGNANGYGPESPASNVVVTPTAGLPGNPTIDSVTSHDGSLTVALSDTNPNPGPILSYHVTVMPGNITVTGLSPIAIALTPGISYGITATATNSTGTSGPSNVHYAIPNAAPSLSIPALGGGDVGASYTRILTVTGGTRPVSWALTAGKLPGGLLLDQNTGVVSGTPTATGTEHFTVQVTDADGQTASQALTITITDTPTLSTLPGPPAGEVGAPYSDTLQVDTGTGTAPFVWSPTSSVPPGLLPPGLSLSQAGVISGTPAAAGTFNFAVQVVDAAGQRTSVPMALLIVPGPTLPAVAIPEGITSVSYSTGLSVAGGTGPFTWSISAGSLPPGISLTPQAAPSASASLVGTPALGSAGTYSFTVHITDAKLVTATLPITITVVPSGASSRLMAATPDGKGYWIASPSGAVTPFGDAGSYGSAATIHLNRPIIAMAATPDGHGYWLLGGDGGIFSFGDAAFYGSTGGMRLNQPVNGMAATPDGHGYWLVASDGGIFTFGDAAFYGSTGNIHLNQPVNGMAASPDGHGYWLVASDGGIFTFGDAAFYGSTGNIHLNQPVNGMAASPDGHGYWLVASDGGIFTFGDAHFYGSTGNIHLNQPVNGMAASPDGHGYWLVASDGGIFTFGDAGFYGSTAGR